MTLPTFLVFGAARCGTTSLHQYLGQHPEVFMSAVKEPQFFERTPKAPPTVEAYEALFAAAGDARAVGESTPTYIRHPEVPGRVRELLPEVRLVALLRDPVERAYSSYLGLKRDGLSVPATFEAALREREHLVASGRYHEQLLRWYDVFRRERILVLLHDDLRDDPHPLFAELFAFLGVDPSFVPDLEQRLGATGRVANPVVRAAWERAERPRRLVRPLLPKGLRDRAYERVTRDLVRPPVAAETRADLVRTLRPDILALQDLLGRDLARWLE